MEGFKEFQGKSLDEAISEACGYFDATRERLEIDIVQDSKSGIFGLVGARKAKVRARRAQLRNAVDDVLGHKRAEPVAGDAADRPSSDSPGTPDRVRRESRGRGKQSGAGKERARDAEPPRATEEAPRTPENAESARASERRRKNPPDPNNARRNGGRGNQREAEISPPRESDLDDVLADDLGEELQSVPFEDLDQDRLRALSGEAVSRLVEPIVGRLPVEVELRNGRVNVRIDCGEDSGLLIGREGQTLASLQYLASRMVSRAMGAAVRIHLDAGEYRRRQDEKLRDMALALAERVRGGGKPCSTRPLSSYHRRIVHMALQDVPDIQTRSSGEGPLKRVVIQRKKD